MSWYSLLIRAFQVTLGPLFMAQQPLSGGVVKKLLIKPGGMTGQEEEVLECLEMFLQECDKEGGLLHVLEVGGGEKDNDMVHQPARVSCL